MLIHFEYSDLSLNLSRSQYLEKLSQHFLGKFSKNKISEERFPSSTIFGMANQFADITLSTANDNVENNTHLIPLRLLEALFDKMADWLTKLNANPF